MTRRQASTARGPVRNLRARLDEAEDTLAAIRGGKVDAVIVAGPDGEEALTFGNAGHPYAALLNSMTDGAAFLDHDGVILFGNTRLVEISGVRPNGLHGAQLQKLVAVEERSGFEAFLRAAAGSRQGAEFHLVDGDDSVTAVWITLVEVSPRPARPSRVGAPRKASVLMAIITDLTHQKRAEAARLDLMKRLLSAEDDERRRIARELHDETGQSLTALLVGLRAIEEKAGARDVQLAARRLRKVAAQTVDNVGRLARGLHPSVLDDMGLAAAVQRHLRDFAAAFDVAVDLRVASIVAERLPALAQTTMYRILQEAVTNVARHAAAKTVSVELRHVDVMLELVVRDDGVGFDVRVTRADASGLGLHGMRERVALLGGSIDVTSRPGEGTTIRASIPIGPAARVPALGRSALIRGRTRGRASD